MFAELREENSQKYRNKIVDKYKKIRANKHRIPTIYDFDYDEKQQIKDIFGNLKALCKNMGDTPTHGGSWIPDDIYFDEIADLADYLGYPPHSEDYSRSASITNRLHGNWHDVLAKAGIKATFASPTIKVSKEEVMYKAKESFKKSNKPYLPTWNTLKCDGVPVASIYLYWPSMSEFRRDLHIPSKKEWQWNRRESILKGAAINLLKNKTTISIDTLLKESDLRHSQIVHIIKQYGGLKSYIAYIQQNM